MAEPPPDKKDPGTGSTDRTDTNPSVRSVAVGAVSLTVAALAIVGFAIAGPLGLLAAGGLTAAGGAVAVRARRAPRSRSGGRSGLLATLAGRPRRPRSSKGIGSLPWPLTGSQSRRASKGRAAGGSGATGGSRRRSAGAALRGLASGMPKLPAVTKKGRAKRSAAHLATGSHGGTARKATAPRAAVRPGAKPTGARAPRTPSRTPARAGSARKLTTAPARVRPAGGSKPGASLRAATRRSPGTGGVGTLRTANRRSNGAQSRRTGRTGLPKTGGGTGGAAARKRSGVRPSPTARPVRRHNRTTGTRPTSRPGGRGPAVRRHKRPSTGTPGTWPRRTGTKATTRARRLGTNGPRWTPGKPTTTPWTNSPKLKRRDHRRPGPASPNRHPHARQPFKRQPTRRLVSTAMRLPRRNGWKISRPTKVQQRRARSHLSKRSKVAARRAARFAVRSPWLLARAGYRHRPLWLWPTAPGPINPDWLRVTERPSMKPAADPRPKKPDTVPVPPSDPPTIKRRHRTPYPQVSRRRAPAGTQPTTGGTITMSAPAQSVAEAFSAIANFTPQTPEDLEAFLQSNAELITGLGAAFQTLAQRMTSELPLAQPVAQATGELGAALAACEGLAGQIHSTYVAAHAVEKDRRENPRPNEGFWDVNNR